MASASRVRAAGGVPEPMASGAMPRERGSATAFFLRRGFPSLLLGARFAALGSATETSCRTGAAFQLHYLNLVAASGKTRCRKIGPYLAQRWPYRTAHVERDCDKFGGESYRRFQEITLCADL